MKFLFRADASISLGFGHVMRCMTLAEALVASGIECAFVCKSTPGNAISMLESRGYRVFHLDEKPLPSHPDSKASIAVAQDADQTLAYANQLQADWVVVDHYALDARWETRIVQPGRYLMAIDDLANRRHSADVILDQNLGSVASAYRDLVGETCKILVGAEYALLRPQFSHYRPESLRRRAKQQLTHLLISMGGTDEHNTTEKILQCLSDFPDTLSKLGSITVVANRQSKSFTPIETSLQNLPIDTQLLYDVSNMAALMLKADLAIGAGGTTSWERCCLGLASVNFCLADNQASVIRHLDQAGAAIDLGDQHDQRWRDKLIAAITRFQSNPRDLRKMSQRASQITDGLGLVRVCDEAFGISVDWKNS